MRAMQLFFALSLLPACSQVEPDAPRDAVSSEEASATPWEPVAAGVWERLAPDGSVQRRGSGAGGLRFVIERAHRERAQLSAAGARGADRGAVARYYDAAELSELERLLPELELAERKRATEPPIGTLASKSGTLCQGNYNLSVNTSSAGGGQLQITATSGWVASGPASPYHKRLRTRTYATGGGPPSSKTFDVTAGCCASISSTSTTASAEPLVTGSASITVSNGCIGYELVEQD